MTTISETITKAKEVMMNNKMSFVTIWKVGKSFSFNFENKNVGFEVVEYGVKRKVIAIIK